ncbi:hypothetical protein CRG98_025479 [Punica granatum]|uniref:Uncharacterized protein n=1 Tax=Punica granatum TaxID=22663 RepID=A0A2I0JCY9_PUNGR|nr:hypothetical protein CRG98_025479 [Punica granatum]
MLHCYPGAEPGYIQVLAASTSISTQLTSPLLSKLPRSSTATARFSTSSLGPARPMNLSRVDCREAPFFLLSAANGASKPPQRASEGAKQGVRNGSAGAVEVEGPELWHAMSIALTAASQSKSYTDRKSSTVGRKRERRRGIRRRLTEEEEEAVKYIVVGVADDDVRPRGSHGCSGGSPARGFVSFQSLMGREKTERSVEMAVKLENGAKVRWAFFGPNMGLRAEYWATSLSGPIQARSRSIGNNLGVSLARAARRTEGGGGEEESIAAIKRSIADHGVEQRFEICIKANCFLI